MSINLIQESRSSQRGGALVMALVPVMLVAAMAAALFQLSMVIHGRQQHALALKRCFYLAESGLHESMVGLYQGRTGIVASEAQPAFFGEGLFWVEIDDIEPGLVRLDCTAITRGARVKLRKVVERISFNYAAFGCFSSEKLKVKKGALVDGYDSRLGSYADQLAAGLTLKSGRLVSNEEIEIEGGDGEGEWTRIHGDAEAGINDMVDLSDDEITLTGKTGSIDEYMPPPDFELPEHTASEVQIKHTSAVPMVIPPGDSIYEKIEIKKGRELVIRGPARVIVEELELEDGATLTLDTSLGDIEFYATKEIKLEDDVQVNATNNDPRAVQIYVGEGTVDGEQGKLQVGKDSVITGLLYVPHGIVDFKERAELFGAIVSNELKLAEEVRLHFDQSLGLQTHRRPNHVAWQILEMGSSPFDPFASMGLNAGALKLPANAHLGTWLEIEYRSAEGMPKQAWEGAYEDFDWSLVGDLHHYKVFLSDGGKELLHVHP